MTFDFSNAPKGATHFDLSSYLYLQYVEASGQWFTYAGREGGMTVWRHTYTSQIHVDRLIPINKEHAPMNSMDPIPYKSNEQIINLYMIEVATLTGVLYAWMESEDYRPIYQYIADNFAGQDAQRGGCLRLSIEVMRILDRILDWEHYDAGVFSYDHLENIQGDIPHLLTLYMKRDDWAELACNYVIPDGLEGWLTDYIRLYEDLRLLRDPERDAAAVQLAQDLGVPVAIAERAYDKGWRKSA